MICSNCEVERPVMLTIVVKRGVEYQICSVCYVDPPLPKAALAKAKRIVEENKPKRVAKYDENDPLL